MCHAPLMTHATSTRQSIQKFWCTFHHTDAPSPASVLLKFSSFVFKVKEVLFHLTAGSRVEDVVRYLDAIFTNTAGCGKITLAGISKSHK